jgi:hypothetical protein
VKAPPQLTLVGAPHEPEVAQVQPPRAPPEEYVIVDGAPGFWVKTASGREVAWVRERADAEGYLERLGRRRKP